VRAQVFHGPGDLRFEEMPAPEPGPGEVLLRVEVALTCGTDVKTLRRGHPVMIPKVPTPFGHEVCGVVAALGAGVDGVAVGDRVVAANSAPCGACDQCRRGRENLCEDLLFVNGAYADLMVLPARVVARNLVRVPRGLPGERLAFAEPAACCLRALELVELRRGDVVAIFGHGPLGLMLGLLAARAGARVVLAGKAGPRLSVAARLGFEACVDTAGAADPVGLVQAAGGGPVRCSIDATGRPEVWEQAVAAVDRGGTVIFFGGCAPGTRIQVDTRRVHYEELRLLGVFHHTPALIRQAVDLLVAGRFDPMPLVTHHMTLAEVPRALEMMRRGEALKIAICP
jgi:L-iditol 2-dehydrogenase